MLLVISEKQKGNGKVRVISPVAEVGAFALRVRWSLAAIIAKFLLHLEGEVVGLGALASRDGG